MQLTTIRKKAIAIWQQRQKLILYPEIMDEIDPENKPLQSTELLDDQYAYIVNTLLIHDYLRLFETKHSSLQPITVFRVWGDFMNMQGLNQFFNVNPLQSEALNTEAIQKANVLIELVISIIFEAFSPLMLIESLQKTNTTIKLFREGGDEIGGLIVIHGKRSPWKINYVGKMIKSVVDSINIKIEQLMIDLGLAFIEYVKDPTHPSRIGCGFVMKSSRVRDPQNSVCQILLERQVAKEKEASGRKRKALLKTIELPPIDTAFKTQLLSKAQTLLNQFSFLKRPELSIEEIEQYWHAKNTFLPSIYFNDIVKAKFTPFVFHKLQEKSHDLHLIVVRFSNLRGMNEGYGHLASDYYVLKLIELIAQDLQNYQATYKEIQLNHVHVSQLSLCEMRVNNTIGILLDLPKKHCLSLMTEIKKRAEDMSHEADLTRLPNYNKDQPNGLPVILILKALQNIPLSTPQAVHAFLNEIYFELNHTDIGSAPSYDKKNTFCPMQVKLPVGRGRIIEHSMPEEPTWIHEQSTHFYPIMKAYFRVTSLYFLGSVLTASSNYFSNAIFLKSTLNNKETLTALNLMYAEQALLINPTLGVTSGIGILIGEADIIRSYGVVGNIFRHSLIINLLVSIPCIITMLSSKEILNALKEPAQAAQTVELYFQSYVCSIPFQMIMRSQQQMLLGSDSTAIGLAQQFSQALTSAVLNYIFIHYTSLAIQSLGYTMTLATALNALVMSFYLACSKKYTDRDLFKCHLQNSQTILFKLSKIGFPYAGQIFVEQLSVFGTGLMAGWLGESPSSALQIISRYVMPATILGFACAQSLATMIGRANGEGNYIKVKQLIKLAAISANLLLLPLELIFCIHPLLLAQPLIDLDDTKNAPIIALLPIMMKLQACTLILDTTRNIIEGGLRGTGNSTYSLRCNVLCLFLSMSLGYAFAFKIDMGISGLLGARLIGLFITNVLLLYKLNQRLNHALSEGDYPVPSSKAQQQTALKIDKQLHAEIASLLPDGTKFTVGKIDKTYSDSLFEAIAQALQGHSKQGHTASSLRRNCYQYMTTQHYPWIEEKLTRLGINYQDYQHQILLTEETYDAFHSIRTEQAIKGQLEIEAQIICEQLGIQIKVIRLHPNPSHEPPALIHITTLSRLDNELVIYLIESEKTFFPVKVKAANFFAQYNRNMSPHIGRLSIFHKKKEDAPYKQGLLNKNEEVSDALSCC